MRHLWAAAAALAIALPAAAADNPKAEFFGGYSLARTNGAADHQNLSGVTGALAFGVRGRFQLVADVSAHWGTIAGVDQNRLSYMAGPAFSFGGGGPRLFVHALFGGLNDKGTIDVKTVSISQSENRFGMQFGGGVDVGFHRPWALRGQVDYVVAKKQDVSDNALRLSVGFVYRVSGS